MLPVWPRFMCMFERMIPFMGTLKEISLSDFASNRIIWKLNMPCVSGFGTAFMFLVPMSVCVDNFPGPIRGTIVGLTSSFFMVGPIAFGALYAAVFSDGPIGNYCFFLAIACIMMNLLSTRIVRPIPFRSDQDAQQQVNEVKSQNSSSCDDDDGRGSTDDWCERWGINLLKIPAFHILSWCFLLVAPLQVTVFTNITTMAASFGHSGLLLTLPIYGPVCALLTMPTVGLISDCTTKYVSRVAYIIVSVVLETLFFVFSIFWGDGFYIFFGLVISVYFHTGILYSIIPTLLSERFGTRHLMRNWGAELLASGLLAIIMCTVAGAFYQDAITDGGAECFGLVCFHHTFILGSILCLTDLLLCITFLYLERKRARGYDIITWNREYVLEYKQVMADIGFTCPKFMN